MILFFYLLLAIVGLIFGSFLGALTYRLPKSISITRGRSFCPNCRKSITWFDNIPLLSFLLLRGKCRNCKKKISWRYFLIESGTAAVFVFYLFNLLHCNSFFSKNLACSLYSQLGLSSVVVSLALFLIVISIFIIDFEEKIIPDELNFWGLVLAFFFFIFSGYAGILNNFFWGGLFSAVFVLIYLLTRGRGMGLGDAKMVFWLGFFLGFPGVILWLLLAFLTGAEVGIILILTKKTSFGKEISFGPFLSFSFFLIFFFGNKFLTWIGF
jgi:leader peptidase (prepilin peptidase)/N-methyltransferase